MNSSPFLIALALSIGYGAEPELRLGIIGVDTSHATDFTQMFNDQSAKQHVAGARVVTAFAGGSPDIAASRDRLVQFRRELQERWKIPFVAHIEDLCPLVDGLLLESVDGRAHLDQFRQAAVCGKPVFIDKPLASTLKDAQAIRSLAAERSIPWFTASSLRFGPVTALQSPDLKGAIVWGPGPLEEHHRLDLSWYGIHAVEALFVLMGPGVADVTRAYSTDADVITARWKDDRIGTIRTLRPYGPHGAVVFLTPNRVKTEANIDGSYAPLLQQIVRFMRTGKPPVANAETIEMFKFMDAAQKSREQGGATVAIE
jgi:hypothetical protein